ncbi:hypothetical protein [Microvirga zambiensis]|uniref:hypothetical protein n=1 Tax=Microvirga zambiensis TaxID=1402137 RepID=UPI00191CF82A|nr:hypothetical protein [Microvirga zambiensis]
MVEKVKYRPYDLRHFFALMLLLERKVNLKKIQTLMVIQISRLRSTPTAISWKRLKPDRGWHWPSKSEDPVPGTATA